MNLVTTRFQTPLTRTNALLNWTRETRISKQGCSCCAVARQEATYHRLCRLMSIPSLIKPKAHHLLLGTALDPCSKLDLVLGALPPALVQLTAGVASGLTSSTLSRLTPTSNSESLCEDLHLRSLGNLAPERR